jgi:ferredoxin-NADP reductase/DMSO/TMAO reductase YedYZ heme-binding membrane subunit
MKDISFARFVLLINGIVPGALLLWDAINGNAGTDPVNYAIRTTGLLTLIFLSLTLLVTPLRKITGLNWLFHFRRRLGLFAFFYGLTHFSIFFIFDRALNLPDTLSEMIKRPYLIVGSLGLFVMVPLAVTSTNSMIRRMNPKRWHALHRLVYFVAVLGVLHFYMQVKSDTRLPIAFAIVMTILLGYRAAVYLSGLLKKPSMSAISVDTPPAANRWQGRLQVKRIIRETRDVNTFRLASPENGELPFNHLPGQYLTFSLMIDGKTVKRNYTIASAPTRRGYCEVTIKREEQGLVSRYMHDRVKEGDILQVAAAAGRFTFSGTEAGRIALLAAGVGITPLMSILRNLTDQNWAGDIYLIFSCKTEADIIFREEMESLQQRFPNLHLTFTLTRTDNNNWNGNLGRIETQLLTRVIPDMTNIPFYLCGPAEMIKATTALLQQMGILESSIHSELFGSKRSAMSGISPSNGETFSVTFNRSNKMARIDGNQPILELAEQLEIAVDSECRSGICGTCKCQLVSGSVKMETRDALDSTDQRNNIILLCQALALDDVTVEL